MTALLPAAPPTAVDTGPVTTGRTRLRRAGLLFAGRTIGRLVLVLLGVLTLLFYLLRASGDAAQTLAGPDATPADVDALRHSLGLDKPLWQQYLSFLGGAAHLDFGNSYRSAESAMGLVLERLPATLGLIFLSYLFAAVIAIPLGMLAALTRSRIYGRFVDGLVVVGQSVPVFALSVVLVYLVGVKAHWVPTLADNGFASGFAAIIVPVVCLALNPVAQLTEVTRAGLHDSMREDFIRTAESKGLKPWTVVRRHALRPVVSTLLNITAVDIAGMLSGGVVVESIFAWPGIGPLLVSSVSNKDYPVVGAATFLVAILVVLINLIVDLLTRRLDPRIRKDAS
jgi:peptide/nickel transport system permease protein